MMNDAQLTALYNEANGIQPGKSPPITTERIFTALRFARCQMREQCANLVDLAELTELTSDESACQLSARIRRLE